MSSRSEKTRMLVNAIKKEIKEHVEISTSSLWKIIFHKYNIQVSHAVVFMRLQELEKIGILKSELIIGKWEIEKGNKGNKNRIFKLKEVE